MSHADFDLAICGAGPTGCTLALLLAQYSPKPERIALIGRLPAASGAASDPRAIALNYGSQSLLTSLDAWPSHSAAIENVHVTQKGYLGRTLISHEDLAVPTLGSVVAYDALIQQLHQAVAASPIHFIQTQQPAQAQPGPVVRITRPDSGQPEITAQLAIQSDGHRPKGVSRDYRQHAVLATVHSSQPMVGHAFERFTTNGPFALLPHPQSPAHYALIWCLPPAMAQQQLECPAADFEQNIWRTFGPWLGELKLSSERYVFPLSLHAGAHQQAERIVAIGNAAQTLHPVAGQGLNLGLRDVAQLALCLRPWLLSPQQDPGPMIDQFVGQRQPDRWLTIAITDTLAQIFTQPSNLLRHALGLGLLSFDLFAAPRRAFARHLLYGLRS